MKIARRPRISRLISRSAQAEPGKPAVTPDLRRVVDGRVIDFTALGLPVDVRDALGEAFWAHFAGQQPQSVRVKWCNLKPFGRFNADTRAVQSLSDVNTALLQRYLDWLNKQCDRSGVPLSKTSRASRYGVLNSLLRWLERCRPGLWPPLHYPVNPFPYKHRETTGYTRLSAEQLRAILAACEQDIAESRALRARTKQAIAAAGADEDPRSSLGALLTCIQRRFGGIVPSSTVLCQRGNLRLYRSFARHGGVQGVEAHLYPSRDALLPYYIAILIHTAGNPDAIAKLTCNCLQPIPLLAEQEMLVLAKPRASKVQRRAFRRSSSFEPPTLVRELLEWTSTLRPRAGDAHRDRLFLTKSERGVSALNALCLAKPLKRFIVRHGLPRFSLASLRPSVLTAIYRSSGDLRQAKSVANHSNIATTIGYVQGPATDSQNRVRIATLQTALLGQLAPVSPDVDASGKSQISATRPERPAIIPPGTAVTMFGFGCRDPFAGVAPGTHRGELCTNFLGCLTCPNAVIAGDTLTVARLLQARDHLRSAAAVIHPARWEAIYAPQLRILEEDVLGSFAARELAHAERLCATLPPLPPLR